MVQRLWCALALAGAWMIATSAAARDDAPAANARTSHVAPTAAELSALPAFEEPMLSPDGARLAAIAPGDEGARVLLFDAAHPAQAPQAIRFGEGEQLNWVRWAGSGRLLLSLQPAAPAKAAAHLVALDLASGERTRIAGPEGDDIIHIDRTGRFLLLSAGDRSPSVYRADLVTGASQRVVAPQPGVSEWFADSAGVVRAGVGSRGDRRWLVYRARDGEAFRRSSGGGGDIDELTPIAGTDQGYAIAGTRSGRYALFRYDFASDRLGALVYENEAVDVDGFQTTPEGKLLGVTFTDEREHALWLDSAMAAHQHRIDAALPARLNRIVSMSADRARLLVFSKAPDDPGSYHLFDAATARLTAVADPHPGLRGKPLAAMQAVRFRARDGLEIPGYLTLPPGREARGLPLIVMPHGGPYARDSWEYDPWVQYLAGKGYAVLQPNFRGSTGFGRDYVARGDGEWGRGMQDDVDDGVKWLTAQGVADAGRVCIMGASYGGYAAMLAAHRNPELYRCAIAFAGISDVAAQLRYDRTTFESERLFRAWRARIQGKAPSLDMLSPIKSVARMTVPLLIAHGTADRNVPFEQSRWLHEALERAGRAHEYLIYPGEEHGLADPENSADFLTRVGAFLDRYNPG
jgi:dipeptidyl aminopeptidase/acylaminoacyl peptidase